MYIYIYIYIYTHTHTHTHTHMSRNTMEKRNYDNAVQIYVNIHTIEYISSYKMQTRYIFFLNCVIVRRLLLVSYI